MGARSRQAREVGQAVEREVDLARGAAELVALEVLDEVVGQLARVPTILKNVSRGSTLDDTTAASISSPFSSTTPVARPPRTRIFAIGASVRISTPASRAASAIAFGDRARAAAREAPGAERAVDLPHVVVEQDVRRARASGRRGRSR